MEAQENCSSAHQLLKLDEACVTLASELDTANLWLYTLSADCVAVSYYILVYYHIIVVKFDCARARIIYTISVIVIGYTPMRIIINRVYEHKFIYLSLSLFAAAVSLHEDGKVGEIRDVRLDRKHGESPVVESHREHR